MLIDTLITKIRNITPNYNPKVILGIGSIDLGQSIEFNLIYPNAKIYAFEANPNQAKLCEELSTNFKNITVTAKAISDIDGFLDFYVTHGNIGASSLLVPLDVPFGTTKDFTKIQVESIRLDNWLEKNKIEKVDIIWLDTQGCELNVLKSMGDYFDNLDFIHCEAATNAYYKGHILKPELENFLISKGFEVIFLQPAFHPYGEGDIIAFKKSII
jgi:FkbM family methyltransferase